MLLRLATCTALLSAGCALSNTVVSDDKTLNEATVIAEIHAGEQARRAAAAAGDDKTAMQCELVPAVLHLRDDDPRRDGLDKC